MGHRAGDRVYRDPLGYMLVLRVERHPHTNAFKYVVGTGFPPEHQDTVCNSFITYDLTEFKVNVAQRIGKMLARHPRE